LFARFAFTPPPCSLYIESLSGPGATSPPEIFFKVFHDHHCLSDAFVSLHQPARVESFSQSRYYHIEWQYPSFGAHHLGHFPRTLLWFPFFNCSRAGDRPLRLFATYRSPQPSSLIRHGTVFPPSRSLIISCCERDLDFFFLPLFTHP